MWLLPLATNTTNTNWWIFPSLLDMVNIPPSPWLALVPLLVGVIVCLLVLFARFFLSVYLSVYFPLVLSMSSAKKCTHSTPIAIQICSLERPTQKKKKKKRQNDPWNRHSLSEQLDRECWPDRQTFCGLLVFSRSEALPSLSEWPLLAYVIYAHVANASSCFGPCVPHSTLLECCLMVGK